MPEDNDLSKQVDDAIHESMVASINQGYEEAMEDIRGLSRKVFANNATSGELNEYRETLQDVVSQFIVLITDVFAQIGEHPASERGVTFIGTVDAARGLLDQEPKGMKVLDHFLETIEQEIAENETNNHNNDNQS